MKIKAGDTIVVITGKDKGKEGVVERIYKNSGTVLVPGINMYSKAVRKSEQNPAGGRMDVPRALKVSKVMIKEGKDGKSRIGYKVEKGQKVRFLKKSGAVIKTK
jgi:large subunit ribosomal protein L24